MGDRAHKERFYPLALQNGGNILEYKYGARSGLLQGRERVELHKKVVKGKKSNG